ncbi:MAG: lipoate--protein ligase family protein [Alphaproteobacteria bacterium]|nr:lipoate--protein ligase family protein [Alphaproteobacteria bacterium]
MTGKPFRVIDTGLRDARANIAFSQALIDLRIADQVPDTIRFLRFPASVLIGRHQFLAGEVRLDVCRDKGFEVARRVTGGGVVFMAPGMLGWELVCRRDTLGSDNMGELARLICEAAADGISRLGLPAKYRPPNDIEVNGHKISGTGGYFADGTLFYQGTLLIDFDPDHMIGALNTHGEKRARRALESAAHRIITVRELLGERTPELPVVQKMLLNGLNARLDVAAEPGAITEAEESRAQELLQKEIGTDAFVAGAAEPEPGPDVLSATHTTPGGVVRAHVGFAGPDHVRIRDVLLSGDFFVAPPSIVTALQGALGGLNVEDAMPAVDRFFAGAKVGLMSIKPEDFRIVIEAALKHRMQ